MQKVMEANFKFKFKNFHCRGIFSDLFSYNIIPSLSKTRYIFFIKTIVTIARMFFLKILTISSMTPDDAPEYFYTKLQTKL